jgi:hypothetical protein
VELDARLRMVSAVKKAPFGEGDEREESPKEAFCTSVVMWVIREQKAAHLFSYDAVSLC